MIGLGSDKKWNIYEILRRLEKILYSVPHVCPGTSSQIGHVPDQLRVNPMELLIKKRTTCLFCSILYDPFISDTSPPRLEFSCFQSLPTVTAFVYLAVCASSTNWERGKRKLHGKVVLLTILQVEEYDDYHYDDSAVLHLACRSQTMSRLEDNPFPHCHCLSLNWKTT